MFRIVELTVRMLALDLNRAPKPCFEFVPLVMSARRASLLFQTCGRNSFNCLASGCRRAGQCELQLTILYWLKKVRSDSTVLGGRGVWEIGSDLESDLKAKRQADVRANLMAMT